MFRGRFVHTIDQKGRVSIPVQHRSLLSDRSEKPPFLTNGQRCVELYHNEDWLEIEDSITSASDINPKVKAYQRFMISGAMECPVDSQGRVLVPQHLRDHAHLEREVAVVGAGNRIELWDKALFDAELDGVVRDFEVISRSFGDSGS